MKHRDKIRAVLCLVSMSAAICLAGCSISFCGYPLGERDELVFSCREESAGEERKDTGGDTSERAAVIEPETSDAGTADGKVNINTAGIEELMTLKGVGETRAKAIIEYRTQNGEFTKAEDIMLIPGIKEGIYTKIQDQIIVQ